MCKAKVFSQVGRKQWPKFGSDQSVLGMNGVRAFGLLCMYLHAVVKSCGCDCIFRGTYAVSL